jgi:hypothetical protein
MRIEDGIFVKMRFGPVGIIEAILHDAGQDEQATDIFRVHVPAVHVILAERPFDNGAHACRRLGLDQMCRNGPKLRAEIMKLHELPNILPSTTALVTAQERERQIAER